MKRIVVPIGILAGCIAVAVYLIRSPTQMGEVAPELIPIAVRVAEVQLESVQLTVESQGKVQPAQIASLSAPVAGPIAWISPALEAGGYVEEGQTLLRLDTSDYETARDRSRAGMQQALAESRHADNELERIEALAKDRLASDSQLQDARRMAEVNRARQVDAEAMNRQAELDYERSEIKAPLTLL